ncbi:hypothetical protein ACIRRA_43595 [Nocardia sp. NPDC101769]|uniref:hypothetical protein n=1 Tax=Nocardia sp. NPDC101769 TaxID=3364333 RepID=UPI0037F31449
MLFPAAESGLFGQQSAQGSRGSGRARHAILARAGVSGIDLATAARLLSDFAIGTSMADAAWRKIHDPALVAKARTHIMGLAHLYPTLSASSLVDGTWSDDELFHRGLARVLDAVLPAAGTQSESR